jgi:hexokinase
MVINLEWGAFGDNKELQGFLTNYDRHIDINSENRGQQTFEKMVSGLYMGDLLRLLLIDLIEAGLIFDGHMPVTLNNNNKIISTEVISTIESDPPGTYNSVRQVLKMIGMENPTDGDCMNVRYAAECVSKRSAHLVAAGLAVILNKMNKSDVTIGVDGSVYRYHPFYHKLLVNKVNELVNPGIKFDIMLSEDGSGKGAAVLASSVNK